MKLDALSIHGLRSLRHVDDLPILDPTVLTGPNDSGKSTVLLALHILLQDLALPEGARSHDLDAGEDVHVEGRFTVRPEESAELGLATKVRLRRVLPAEGAHRLEIFRSVPRDPALRDLSIRGRDELKALAVGLGLQVSDGRRRELWLEALTDHVADVEHVDAWVTAGRAVEAGLPSLLNFDGTAAPDADSAVHTALTAMYRTHLSAPEIAGRIAEIEAELVERVRADAADLCGHIGDRHQDLGTVDVHPTVALGTTRGLTNAPLTTESPAGPVRLAETGSGRARRVTLAVWEWTAGALVDENASARDVVVTYDEPDTHLDYEHQRSIMDTVLRQRSDHVRSVVTTHSMNLIDGVDLDNVVNLSLRGGQTSVMHLAPDSGHEETDRFIRETTAALGVRNSVLLHERLFVGVEGETEMRALPGLFRLHTGRSLQSAGIALWPGGNDVGAARFTEYLVRHGRPVAFVVDEDSRTNQKSWFSDRKLRDAGVDPVRQAHYLGAPNEFEELFSDRQWADAAQETWPRTDGVPWTEAHVSACRERKFSSEWLSLVREAAGASPLGKPELAFALVRSLRTPDQIPTRLRETFDSLLALAH